MISIEINEGECLQQAALRQGFVLACHSFILDHLDSGTIYILDGKEYLIEMPVAAKTTLLPRQYKKIERYNGILSENNCMIP